MLVHVFSKEMCLETFNILFENTQKKLLAQEEKVMVNRFEFKNLVLGKRD